MGFISDLISGSSKKKLRREAARQAALLAELEATRTKFFEEELPQQWVEMEETSLIERKDLLADVYSEYEFEKSSEESKTSFQQEELQKTFFAFLFMGVFLFVVIKRGKKK